MVNTENKPGTSIRFRFVRVIAIVLAIGTVLLSVIIGTYEKKALRESLREDGQSLAHFIAKLGKEALVAQDTVILDSIAHDAHKEDIAYTLVYDIQGNLLTSQYASLNYRSPIINNILATLPREIDLPEIINHLKRKRHILEISSPVVVDITHVGNVVVGMSEHVIRRQILTTILFIVAVNLSVISVLGGVLFSVSRKILFDPISALSESTTQLARGDLSVRVNIPASGELKTLLANFNHMVADLKKAEDDRIKLEEQLRHSQKLESVGRLAGGVAHDFNNKLTVILGYAELAGRIQADNPNLAGYLREIARAAEHSRDITAQLLAFSRQQIASPKPVAINQIIMEAGKSLPRLIGEDITFNFVPGEGLWIVKIDPVQLDQIIINLAVNARDAMPDGGAFSITTANVSIDRLSYLLKNPDARHGDYVEIVFSDSGTGMDQEVMKHIFEPFYTTKGVGKGTGLGLATIYGIVTQNNGFISVDSKPGLGTVFRIYLPTHSGGYIVEVPQAEQNQTGRGVVLLVEDEEMVRQMTGHMLEEMGYVVKEAATPREAIQIASNPQTPLDVVLTDVVMPEMNGAQLMRIIHGKRPELQVLYMSGYTSDLIARKGIIQDGVNFIQKPFDMKTLNDKLSQAIKLQGGGFPGSDQAKLLK